jgi:hypothetical protein
MVFYFLIALHLAQVFDDKYKSGLIELHGAPKAPLGSESGLIELHGAPKVPIGLENTFTTSFFRQTTQFFV